MTIQTIKITLFGNDKRAPIAVEPPELDIRLPTGAPLGTVTVRKDGRALAFWVRPAGGSARYLCPINAPQEGVADLIKLAGQPR
ncbi:hypothetical protein AB0M95_26565 [Sphaerisporangium sp. NPDC051017]|uniref:hypothetical protein n=1 Tax=Sphaerisporangium sp. NPDC051017 TaxID=3154636 RepID=UPI0034469AD9